MGERWNGRTLLDSPSVAKWLPKEERTHLARRAMNRYQELITKFKEERADAKKSGKSTKQIDTELANIARGVQVWAGRLGGLTAGKNKSSQ